MRARPDDTIRAATPGETPAGRRGRVSRLAAMPGRLRTSLLAGACALALAGCGSGDGGTIPQGDSDVLISLTQDVQNDVANGDCEAAREHANELADRVRALPKQVEPEVRNALEGAAANLVEQTQQASQCQQATGASGPTGAEATTAPTTETTPTTTEESTEPTTTEEETTTTTTTTEESGPGNSQGQGPTTTPPGQGGEAPGQAEGGAQGGNSQDGATGSFDDESGGVTPGGDATTP